MIRPVGRSPEWGRRLAAAAGTAFDGRCGRSDGGRRRRRRRRGAVLRVAARQLEKDEVREGLGAAGGLGRAVPREVVERGGEDGADAELAREVDDVDRGGDLVARVVVAVGCERHALAAVPLCERRGEVALQPLQALAPWDADEVLAGEAEDRGEEGKVLHEWLAEVSVKVRARPPCKVAVNS